MAKESKIENLQDIRRKFGLIKDQKQYPHCGYGLTIETTQFFRTELCENCFEFSGIEEIEGCCSNPNLQKVKYVVEGGSIQVRNQCMSCGWCSGNSIGGLTKEQREALPSLDETKRDQFNDGKFAYRRAFNSNIAEKKAAIKKREWFDQYSNYLKSPQWLAKRELVLKRDNYRCQCCLDALATQVHHKSYAFVDMNGSEPAFDLVAVCTPCHKRIEAMKDTQVK